MIPISSSFISGAMVAQIGGLNMPFTYKRKLMLGLSLAISAASNRLLMWLNPHPSLVPPRSRLASACLPVFNPLFIGVLRLIVLSFLCMATRARSVGQSLAASSLANQRPGAGTVL